MPGNFGYRAEFSLIVKNGRSREPLIQAFREEIDSVFGLVEKFDKGNKSLEQ
ncbi:hypothetical protein D9M69_424590 [compost metagenome]